MIFSRRSSSDKCIDSASSRHSGSVNRNTFVEFIIHKNNNKEVDSDNKMERVGWCRCEDDEDEYDRLISNNSNNNSNDSQENTRTVRRRRRSGVLFPVNNASLLCSFALFALLISSSILCHASPSSEEELDPAKSIATSSSVSSSSSSSNSNLLVSESEIKTIEPTNNPTKVFVRRRIFRKLVKDGATTTSNGTTSSGSNEEPSTTTQAAPPATEPQTTPTPPKQKSQRPRTLYSLVKRIDNSKETPVTGNTLKSSMSTSVSLSSKQRFNFASLKTRLGLAATTPVGTTTTPSPPQTTPITSSNEQQNSNDSLLMIPLPPSQRKPYTPVIVQVSKSTTAKPSTTTTYKLNKMFVPIGIYGKVLGDEDDKKKQQSSSINEQTTAASTPPDPEIRHKGTDDSGERKHKGIADTVDLTYGRPDIGKISLTTEKPDIGSISITTEKNELFSGLWNNNDEDDGADNSVRRGDGGYYNGGGGGYNRGSSGSNNKKKHQSYSHQDSSSSNSGLTIMTPPSLGTPLSSQDSSGLGSSLLDSYSSYSSYSAYPSTYSSSPPYANNYKTNKFTPSAVLDSITGSMSRIPSLVPSLFHKGLTSLSSLTTSLKENPFVDENFNENNGPKKNTKLLVAGVSNSGNNKIPASVPGGYIEGMQSNRGSSKGNSNSNNDQVYAGSEMNSNGKNSNKGYQQQLSEIDTEYETLEYFRKRPHLLAQLQQEHRQKQQQQNYRRSSKMESSAFRYSKGFKPATAPDLLAKEYYKSTSTSTTQMTPDSNDIPIPSQQTLPPEPPLGENRRSSKYMKMRNSWLLRNSNEYVANRNEKLIRMWRNMLDEFTEDEDQDQSGYNNNNQQQQQPYSSKETPSNTKMASRRISTNHRTNNKPTSPLAKSPLYKSIKSKYSKDQLNEAKERILTLLSSGYGDDALLEQELADEEELQHGLDYSEDTASHMPPPPPPPPPVVSVSHSVHTHGHSSPHHHHHHAYHGLKTKSISLTKGLSTAAAGAFRDLVKFFKLGVSVGTGQAREPVNYEQVVDLQEEEESDWKPVVRRPLISFSAGISVKNPSPSKPKYHHHHQHADPYHFSHPTSHLVEEEVHVDTPTITYESSPTLYEKPFVDEEIVLATPPPHHHHHDSHHHHDYSHHEEVVDEAGEEELLHHHHAAAAAVSPPKSVSYTSFSSDIVAPPGEILATPAQSLDYTDDPDPVEGYESNTQTYVASAPSRYSTSRPSNYYDYSTLKTSGSRRPSSSSLYSITSGQSSGVGGGIKSSLSDYELVPSSLYLNGQNDPNDIAAVVKPAGISEDLVRQALPPGMRNLRILDYPNEYASLNSISQRLQQQQQLASSSSSSGGIRAATPSSSSFKSAMKKLRENYVVKESTYLPPPTKAIDETHLYNAGGLEEIDPPSSLTTLYTATPPYSSSPYTLRGSSLSSLTGSGGLASGASLSSLSGIAGLTGQSSSSSSSSALSSLAALQQQNSDAYQAMLGSSGFNLQPTYYNPLQQSNSAASLLLGGAGGNPRESVFSTADRINNLGRFVGGGGGGGDDGVQHQQQQQQVVLQGSQKDALGFTSNYNLPQHLDPDIAAILKSELDKDDIPEDVRQEFLEAKEQEKKEQQQKLQQQQQQASRRVDDAQQSLIDSLLESALEKTRQAAAAAEAATKTTQAPATTPSEPTQQYNIHPTNPTPSFHNNNYHHQYPPPPHHRNRPPPRPYGRGNRGHGGPPPNHHQALPPPPPPPMPRTPPVVATKFFAPIPITPTLMTAALKNPRYASPVPRYVIELAKKLQSDKSVQGIVRVSAKRGRGLPPIEYLYPVKG